MTKILIIEDNKSNLELMVYLFDYYEYQIITATDGEEALVKINQDKPDLIICDVNLPKVDGYQIANILKNDPILKKIPLVAVTAYAMLGDRDKIRAAGFDAYIPKPINPSQFVIQIESLLPSDLRLDHQVEIQANVDLPQQNIPDTTLGVALVVTDYVGTIELFKLLLESIGFEVVTARNVKVALEKIQQQMPNIILSDFHMAETNGLKFLDIIRSNNLWQSIPFIIFSPIRPSTAELEEIKRLHANRFISLPIDANVFIKIIKDTYAEFSKSHLSVISG